jgi:hypothetical protein
MNEAALVIKCQKIYDSCETKEHYTVAYNYLKLAQKRCNTYLNWKNINNLFNRCAKIIGCYYPIPPVKHIKHIK